MRLPIVFIGLGLALGAALIAESAQAQTNDHLKCYRIKGDLRLRGTVDIATPQFDLEPGCKISRAKFFCVPATKSGVEVMDGAKQPITPLPLSAPPAPGDRICWSVRCPETFPSDQVVTDQFGTQTLTKFKFGTKLLCTPAVKGTEFCGDGSITGSEECEPTDDRACPGVCQPDCSCGASSSICASPSTCFSDLIVDQFFDPINLTSTDSVVGAGVCASGFPLWVQTFTVGVSGTLEMLQLKVYRSCGPPTLPDTTFTIDLVGVDGNGIPDPDSILATGTFHTDNMPPYLVIYSDGFVRVDLPAPGVQVLVGQAYGIVARQPPGGCYLWVLDESGGYPGGDGFRINPGGLRNAGDFGFRTVVSPF